MSTSKNTYPADCSVEYPVSPSRLLAILFILKATPLYSPHFLRLHCIPNGNSWIPHCNYYWEISTRSI